MGDSNAHDQQSHKASERLEDGLKSCRKVVDSYTILLRQRPERAEDGDEEPAFPDETYRAGR